MDQKNSSLYFIPLVIGSFIDDTKQLSNKETLLYLDLIIHEWQQLKRDRYLTEVGLKEIKGYRYKYGNFEKYLLKLLDKEIVEEQIIEGKKIYTCRAAVEGAKYIHTKTKRNPMECRKFPSLEYNNINALAQNNTLHKDKDLDKYINTDNDKDNSIDKFKNLPKLLKSVRDK